MIRFIIRRLFQLVFVLWAGATLLFFLMFTLPNSPGELIAGGNGRAANPQVVRNVNHKLGFDRPVWVQYTKFLNRTIHGDLGHSFRTGESVNDILRERAPLSLRIAFWAIVIEVVVGISSGVLSARRRNSIADTATTLIAVVASAIPVFVLAYLMKQVTGVYTYQHHMPGWTRLPALGFGPNEFLFVIPSVEQLRYLVQPAIVLAAVSTAILARITRTSMLESLRLEHVRTARAKGLSEKKVVRRHVLRNAMIPVVTIIGIDFGTAAGAAILTEVSFGLPGIGSKIVVAAQQRDLPIVLGLSIFVMAVYGVATLMVDLSYAVLDPRIRLGDHDG
jgi:peptide/nickel transport system permease protein